LSKSLYCYSYPQLGVHSSQAGIMAASLCHFMMKVVGDLIPLCSNRQQKCSSWFGYVQSNFIYLWQRVALNGLIGRQQNLNVALRNIWGKSWDCLQRFKLIFCCHDLWNVAFLNKMREIDRLLFRQKLQGSQMGSNQQLVFAVNVSFSKCKVCAFLKMNID
jgi:hypothetical protein